MKIQVTIKNVYGKETIYPICEQAKIFAGLVRQRTLTRKDIEKIKALGFAIEIVHQDPSL